MWERVSERMFEGGGESMGGRECEEVTETERMLEDRERIWKRERLKI